MKRRRSTASDEDEDASDSPSHPLERGLMGGLEREWRGGWARWSVVANLPDGTVVCEPGAESVWAVCRPTRGLEAPLREQVRASLTGRTSGKQEEKKDDGNDEAGDGGGDRPIGAVEHVSMGRGGEKRIVAALKLPPPPPTRDSGELVVVDNIVSATRQWTAAEETAFVVARVVRPHVGGEAWAPWLQQHGDAVLAALNPRPIAAALVAWSRLRAAQRGGGGGGQETPPMGEEKEDENVVGTVPFYVNRSKRQLDKAGKFTAGLATRLVELSIEASAAAAAARDKSGATGAEDGGRGGSGGGGGGGGTYSAADGQYTCPRLTAQLNGWQLEILCRIQTPQNELHVCVKLTEHPELIAAASAQQDERVRAASSGAAVSPSAAAAAVEEEAADDWWELTSLQPSVGGCMAHLAGCREASARVCVLVSKLSGSAPSTTTTTTTSSSASTSVAFKAAQVAARDASTGADLRPVVAEVTEVEDIAKSEPSSLSAVVCDAAVELGAKVAGEGKDGENFIENLLGSSARALTSGGCLVLLVPQSKAGSVHRAMKKKKTRQKEKEEEEEEEEEGGKEEDEREEIWSAHSTHRASLPTLRNGVKDVPVVLFRIERGKAAVAK